MTKFYSKHTKHQVLSSSHVPITHSKSLCMLHAKDTSCVFLFGGTFLRVYCFLYACRLCTWHDRQHAWLHKYRPKI